MTQREQAEEILKGMLSATGVPVRASYSSGEVCDIFGIGIATFWRLLNRFELNEKGELLRPDCLNSFQLRSHRRIAYPELVNFLARNNSYQRQNAISPDQMALFE